MYLVCGFEIVQYIPVIVVCWGLYTMNTITYHIEINYYTPINHNRQQSTSHQTAPLRTVKSH